MPELSRWHTALAAHTDSKQSHHTIGALLTVYVHVHKTQLHRPAVKFEERYGGGVGEDFADHGDAERERHAIYRQRSLLRFLACNRRSAPV